MATKVPIPPLPESISQVILIRWAKNEGDYVGRDDVLAELETDKANTELLAPTAGVLHQLKKVGDVLKPGDVPASIDESAAAPAGGSKPAAQSATAVSAPAKTPVPPTPAVNPAAVEDMNPSARRQVIENNIDPSKVKATGPHGRLLGSDVADFIAAGASAAGNGNGATAAPEPVKPPVPTPVSDKLVTRERPAAAAAAPSAARQFDANGISRETMSKIRKRTALNLKEAQNTAAILTTFNEVDMSAIMDLRAKHKERFEKTYGVGLGFMSFFAKAVILGLREFSKINASIEGDDIVYHNYLNLGIAVSSERGLTVPVLKHAEQMSFAKIESEIKRLAAAVRDGKLSLTELTGGTFTITNGGVFGSLLSTPILNPPQSGILGMHAINKRPIAINDKVEIRPMMYVALSYDHRIVDGRDSVSFLVRLKEYLEDPARLMLEI